ncbi:acyl-CoA thioesterase domain-containing protein [Phenylobacterium sp. SCN 70-31]|uniref:acyl-CoA thioesterase n=1 Tax=Phenylobacterium sp. SCN 70-31 TaxID=1660129 RepID=UPI00086A447D|nr:acyl-CoA thioesterase domain-containing protein [Phenylobacterium sp. SCN 70-31]ODT86564.1 MAG: acyl-CoA thioesterase [Phenylobacterium sp. SCN 70-31]
MHKLFFDLRATHNPHRWYLPVEPNISVGPPGAMFMFGGVGLASAVSAMERTCDRPVIWATAQYLSYARPGSVVDLDVWTPVEGKYNTQARVIGHVGDKEILTVNAALGARPSDLSEQWVQMPDAPPPEDCEPAAHWRHVQEGLHSRLEVRRAKGRYGADRVGHPEADGRSMIWVRPREGFPIDTAMLAIMADLAPSGLGAAMGRNAGGNSLDNTLRIRRIVPTEWVLCDISMSGMHGGFAHGSMHLFAQDGELMAIASQSMIARIRDNATDR